MLATAESRDRRDGKTGLLRSEPVERGRKWPIK